MPRPALRPAFLLFVSVVASGAVAQDRAAAGASQHMQVLAPGTRYDDRIPTPRAVIGHDFGEEISSPEEMAAYFAALHAAAPDRTLFVEYARSWEGRPLHAFVIASPDRIRRIDAIKTDLRRLADPRALQGADAERLVRELPAVVALVHGVHGNEISPGGAAMAEAYHLLAAQGDATVDAVTRDAIVIIDPAQNPDGRARFVTHYRLGRASTPDATPYSTEHDEPWPGGRSNHYLFDLNRDWFAQTQPETRGKVKLLLEWTPHVVADLHEMGGDSTYYFPPAAPPGNTWRTGAQVRWLQTFGRANAARFDERGFPYFTGEVFDAFYPGYGVSWPTTHGAIGMTYEKASPRGLVYRRASGTLLTYLDAIREHFTAALATVETAARQREQLLRDYLEFRRSASRMGESGDPREYWIGPGQDPAQAERLAERLVMNGIEVRRATASFSSGARTWPAGTFVVSVSQPAARLLRNVLDPHTPMDKAFLDRQDERRKRRLPDQIYDVTAWSLSVLWDVDLGIGAQPSGARTEPFVPRDAAAPSALPPARVGYILPWNTSTAGAVAEALKAGLKVSVSGGAFTIAGRKFPIGAAIVRGAGNPAGLPGVLGQILVRHGAEAVPIDTAFVEEGVSLGSNQVRALQQPRVLLAWDTPTSSLSAGWARFVLEQRYGIVPSAVRVSSFGRADLSQFDVVVLPSGNYAAQLGGDLLRRVKDWISAGGTLITVAEATRWASQEAVGLLATRTQMKDGRPETTDPPKAAAEPAKGPIDLDRAIQPPTERPELVPGAILHVRLDTEHLLSAGTDGEVPAMVEGQRVLSPITLDKGRNVGVYAAADRLVASGFVWPESRDLLPNKAYLVEQPMGRGRIIAFSEDPNARAFAEATQLLFVNAVLFGAAR